MRVQPSGFHMGIDNKTVRRLLSDGGLMSVRQIKGSYLVTLPKESATKSGVEKGTDLPVIPSDRDGVMFEILEPEDRHE